MPASRERHASSDALRRSSMVFADGHIEPVGVTAMRQTGRRRPAPPIPTGDDLPEETP